MGSDPQRRRPAPLGQRDAAPAGGAGGWLTTQEAAARLGVTRFVVARLARTGELPVYEDPFDKRKRLFRVEDLDALGARPRPRPEGA